MAEPTRPDIGKYHIIELVGEGAMGVVYRATDSVLDRTVAIKVMNESIARQEDLRKRFLHEAQAAASLQHPNVVSIYDMGEVDGHMFIAMEFVQGVDLEKLLELGEPLSLQAKLDIIIDVLTGLTFAHKRGIIHRDIKPANIRVTEDGRAKIMDFGVAHLASSSMTSTGSFLGTPSYMAPEQITEGKTTPATDIFAVGGVLFQLLTNQKPFEAPTLQNLFFRIITEKQKRVSEAVPGLPPTLDRIVEKAMAKEPADRYATALEMANDLSAVRAKLSGPSYPESVSLSASVSSAIEQARKYKQTRTRNFAFAGGGALVAVVVLVAWSQLVKPRPASSEPDTLVAPPSAMSTVPAPPSAAAPTNIATERSISEPVVSAPGGGAADKTATDQATRTAEQARATRVVTAPKAPPRPAQKAPTRTTQPAIVAAPRSTSTQTQPASPQPTPQVTSSLPASSLPASSQLTVSQPPSNVVQRPVEPKPQEAAPAPAPPTAADLAPAVQAYARAIESRDIGAVRRAYPGLTGDQQRRFEQFFQAARNINVTFRVDHADFSGSSADARLVGTYEYLNSENRTERQPVSFAATLRHEGGAWRLVSVR